MTVQPPVETKEGKAKKKDGPPWTRIQTCKSFADAEKLKTLIKGQEELDSKIKYRYARKEWDVVWRAKDATVTPERAAWAIREIQRRLETKKT